MADGSWDDRDIKMGGELRLAITSSSNSELGERLGGRINEVFRNC